MEIEAKIKREIRLMKQVQRMYVGIPYHTINRTHDRKPVNSNKKSTEVLQVHAPTETCTTQSQNQRRVSRCKDSREVSPLAILSKKETQPKPKREYEVDNNVSEPSQLHGDAAKLDMKYQKHRSPNGDLIQGQINKCDSDNNEYRRKESADRVHGRASACKMKIDTFAKCDIKNREPSGIGQSKTGVDKKTSRLSYDRTNVQNTVRQDSPCRPNSGIGRERTNRTSTNIDRKTKRRKEINETCKGSITLTRNAHKSSRVERTDILARADLKAKSKPKYHFSHITCGFTADKEASKSESVHSTSSTAPANDTTHSNNTDNVLALHPGRALRTWSSPSTQVFECFGDHYEKTYTEHLNADAIILFNTAKTATCMHDKPTVNFDTTANITEIHSSSNVSTESKVPPTKLTEDHPDRNDGIDTPVDNNSKISYEDVDAYQLSHNPVTKLVHNRSICVAENHPRLSETIDNCKLTANQNTCAVNETLLQNNTQNSTDGRQQQQKADQASAQSPSHLDISWIKRTTRRNRSTQCKDKPNDSSAITVWQANKPVRLLPLRPQLLAPEILFKSTGTSTSGHLSDSCALLRCSDVTAKHSIEKLDKIKMGPAVKPTTSSVGNVLLIAVSYLVTIPQIHRIIQLIGHVNRKLQKWIRRQEIHLLTIVKGRLIQLHIDESPDN